MQWKGMVKVSILVVGIQFSVAGTNAASLGNTSADSKRNAEDGSSVAANIDLLRIPVDVVGGIVQTGYTMERGETRIYILPILQHGLTQRIQLTGGISNWTLGYWEGDWHGHVSYIGSVKLGLLRKEAFPAVAMSVTYNYSIPIPFGLGSRFNSLSAGLHISKVVTPRLAIHLSTGYSKGKFAANTIEHEEHSDPTFRDIIDQSPFPELGEGSNTFFASVLSILMGSLYKSTFDIGVIYKPNDDAIMCIFGLSPLFQKSRWSRLAQAFVIGGCPDGLIIGPAAVRYGWRF